VASFGTFSLTADQRAALERALDDWRAGNKIARLWSRDSTLWTGTDESQWLGWLDIVEAQLHDAARFAQFAKDVRERAFTHILLLGMGGSSLCPEVLAHSFGKQDGFPELHVLDSTNPAQLLATESRVNLAATAAASSRSPIRDRKCSKSPSATDSGASFSVGRVSADATPRCPTSE
jgi:transaldolase/glucose-6-phosphate isomerase